MNWMLNFITLFPALAILSRHADDYQLSCSHGYNIILIGFD